MQYILYAGCLYLLYDFFVVKKHGTSLLFGPSYETNAARVRKLYNNILNLKKITHHYTSDYDPRLILRSITTTATTILKSKLTDALYYLLSPRKFNSTCYVIPYFHQGEVYYILAPIRTHNNQFILHVTGYPSKKTNSFLYKLASYLSISRPPNPHGDNITNEILKYLGPKGNFYGQYVTPADFGYDQLVFDILTPTHTQISSTFHADDIINLF